MTNIKKISLGMICLSIVFIIIGLLFIAFIKTPSKEEPSFSFLITDTTGDSIDTSVFSFYNPNKELSTFKVKSANVEIKNLYNIKLPNDFAIFWSNDISVGISNSDSTVNANSLYDMDIDEYKEKNIESIKSLYNKVNVSYLKSEYKISGYDTEYMIIRGMSEDGDDQYSYTENFFVIVKESDSSFFAISYIIKNKKFSNEFLLDFVQKIEVLKGKANYLYSHIEDNYIIGTLTYNSTTIENSNYKVNYKIVSNNYEEIENAKNNDASTTFISKKDDDLLINVSLNRIISRNDFIANHVEDIKKQYDNNKNILEDISSFVVEYNDKSFYKICIKFFDSSDKETLMYKTHIIYLIDDNLYYDVLFDSSVEPDEDTILDFLDFTLEVEA